MQYAVYGATERLLGLHHLLEFSHTDLCSFSASASLKGLSSSTAIPAHRALTVQTVPVHGSLVVEQASKYSEQELLFLSSRIS